MQIIITENLIEQKIDEYRKRTGATKTWIAVQLGLSKQRLYQLMLAKNMTLDVALKFAEFFECDVKDLVKYEIIRK